MTTARATNSALSGDAWRPSGRCSAIHSRLGPKRSTSAPGGFFDVENRVYDAAPSCVHAFDPPRRRSFGREIGVPAPMTGPLVPKCARQSGKSLYLDFFRPQCWIDVRARE